MFQRDPRGARSSKVEVETERRGSDLVRIYFDEIGRVPLLSATDEVALAKRIERGDTEAKRRLVEANLRLVVSLARKYTGSSVPLADLIQEGNLGLMRAAARFDWRRGRRFTTYATFWIHKPLCGPHGPWDVDPDSSVQGARGQRVRSGAPANRTGTGARAESRRDRATDGRVGRADVEDPADRPRPDLAGDADRGGGRQGLGDLLEDANAPDPAETVFAAILKAYLADLLDALPPRQRRVLVLRFGLDDNRPRTLEEVAKTFGVTRERARQLESKALIKLRRLSQKRSLRDFIA